MNSLDLHIKSLAELPKNYFWHHHRYKVALAYASRKSGRWLDFGCGSGGFIAFIGLERPNIEVVGVDSSSAAPALTPKSLDDVQGQFDVISCLDVIEHIDDHIGTLIKLRKRLSPDGVIIVSVPAYPMLWSAWDRMLGHKRRYTRASLDSILKSSGLSPIRSSYLFSYLLFPAWRRARSGGAADGVEFPRVHPAIHIMLKTLNLIERLALVIVNIPFGTSVIAVARAEGANG